ncbi:hypothetical protein WJ974_24815 [Achromobacter xylosoxidans]
MYDIIGDIHGEDLKLEGLLRCLGYVPAGRGYKAPKAIRRYSLVIWWIEARGSAVSWKSSAP